MKPSNISLAITQCFALKKPLFIWGPPGVGKSDTVRQAARALSCDLIDFRAALRDAVDIMGLPYINEGCTGYALPAGLPRDPASSGILFLDEINTAPAQTQAALYQLVLDRAVGDYHLPDGWQIVAAGNRMTDRGVVHRMPDPLIDRFIHVDFEPELQDWCAWALSNGVRPEVVAFLRFRPALLHSHDTARQCHAFATPRGWADVSAIIGLNTPIEGDLIRGRVGDGAAGEMLAFLKLYRGMVSPDQILLNPLTADVPTNSGILYALAEALARRATIKNIDSVLTYAKRMPREYAAALVSSATRLTPALCNTHEFIAWASAQA
jgi:hypothetical protein